MVSSARYIWRMVVNGSSQGGGCGKTRERGKRATRGWIEQRWTVGWQRDEREDSITRHRQPRAYLVAIGFSLPKASSALYRIVYSASPRETHQDRTSFWNSFSRLSGWRWTSSYCLIPIEFEFEMHRNLRCNWWSFEEKKRKAICRWECQNLHFFSFYFFFFFV